MLKFLLRKRQKNRNYKCPCCGYNTYGSKPNGDYSICPVCFWEDDPFQFEDPNLEGEANEVSLNQARENFKKLGACEERLIKYVRKPRKDELTGLDSKM